MSPLRGWPDSQIASRGLRPWLDYAAAPRLSDTATLENLFMHSWTFCRTLSGFTDLIATNPGLPDKGRATLGCAAKPLRGTRGRWLRSVRSWALLACAWLVSALPAPASAQTPLPADEQ